MKYFIIIIVLIGFSSCGMIKGRVESNCNETMMVIIGIESYFEADKLGLQTGDWTFICTNGTAYIEGNFFVVKSKDAGLMIINCENEAGNTKIIRCYARGGYRLDVKFNPARAVLEKVADTLILSSQVDSININIFDPESLGEDPNMRIMKYRVYFPLEPDLEIEVNSGVINLSLIKTILKYGGVVEIYDLHGRLTDNRIVKLSAIKWIRFI